MQIDQMTRLFIVSLTVTMFLVGCKEGVISEHKECYYCKETDVKAFAVVCKHCGRDPDGPNGEERRKELSEEYIKQRQDTIENEADFFNQLDRGKTALLIASTLCIVLMLLDILWCKYATEMKPASVCVMTAFWVWAYKKIYKSWDATVWRGNGTVLSDFDIFPRTAAKCWYICFSSGLIAAIFYWATAYIGEYSEDGELVSISRLGFIVSLLVSNIFLILYLKGIKWSIKDRVKWCFMYIIWSLVFSLGIFWIWGYVYFEEAHKLRSDHEK